MYTCQISYKILMSLCCIQVVLASIQRQGFRKDGFRQRSLLADDRQPFSVVLTAAGQKSADGFRQMAPASLRHRCKQPLNSLAQVQRMSIGGRSQILTFPRAALKSGPEPRLNKQIPSGAPRGCQTLLMGALHSTATSTALLHVLHKASGASQQLHKQHIT